MAIGSMHALRGGDREPGRGPDREPDRNCSRVRAGIAASILAHLVLLAGLLFDRGPVLVAPVRLPGTAHGSRMVLTYLPGPAASSALRDVRVPPKLRLPAATQAKRSAPDEAQSNVAPVAAQVQQNPGSGLDALGEGDISIALMQFAPDPKPDLSRLPHGSRGDVVLAAVIDAGGRVAQLTVKQGLGFGVDEAVVAAVQQWTFHPAMRDGRPVASRQQFLFHYERG